MLREKLPIYLLCVACLTVSSFAQTLGTNSLTFGPSAGTGTVEVNGGNSWTVSTDAPWLTVTQNGQGSGLLAFGFSANPGSTRTGTITVTDNVTGLAPDGTNTLTITQAGLGYLAASGLQSLGTSGLSRPCGVTVDAIGEVYVAGLAGKTGEVEKWSPATGQFTTVVSSGLRNPCGVAVDTAGNVYIADEGLQAIEEWVASTSQLQTLFSLAPSVPYGVAVDRAGNVFAAISVADPRNATDEFAIVELNSSDNFTTLFDTQVNPAAIAVDATGNVYFSASITGSGETGYAVQELVAQSGYTPTTLFFTGAIAPSPVAVDGAGNVYFGINTAPSLATPVWSIEEWNASTGTVGPPLVSDATASDFSVDSGGNIYFGGLEQYFRAFVNPAAVNEPPGAGSDQLAPVLPAGTPLDAVSDQPWLTITSQSSGIVSFSFTANSSGAPRTAHITMLGQSIAVTQAIGAPASVTATGGTPQKAQINTLFASFLIATVTDSSGSPVSGVAVTFAAPASGASGTFANGLSTATTPTNASGLATAPAFTANAISASYTVLATVANVPTSAVFALTNSAGPPALVTALAGTPQSATVNTAFKAALQVTVQDANGNPVSNATVTFAAPVSGASVVLSSTMAVTNNAGVAGVTAVANNFSGTYTVAAAVASVKGSAAFALTNIAGAPSTVVATSGTPQSTTVNTAFKTSLQVTVQDANSNPVSGATVTFAVPVSGASAVLSSTTVVTNSAGVAGVTAVANNFSGSYTVTAAVAPVKASAAFALTNTAGAASTVVATAGTPQSTTVNTAFAGALQVLVKDANGNPVAGAKVDFTTPASGASAVLSNTTGVTNTAGLASITATANGTAGSYTVTATVAQTAAAASFALINTAGTPASITATSGTPQAAQISTAFKGLLVVSVTDSTGNPVSGVSVTYAVPSSTTASGTFANGVNTAVTNTQGIATSAVFTANGIAGSFTVTATAAKVPGAASFSLTNTPPPLKFSAPSLPSGKVGTAYSATLTATGGTPTYTWSLAPRSAALPSGLTLNAATGAITGIPTVAGNFNFSLQVSDHGSPTQTAAQQVTNFIVLPPTLLLTCNVSGQAKVGVAYSGACKATGGTPPYAYSLATGALPPGLDLDSISGTVTGTGTGTGVYSFVVQVTDSSAFVQTARQSLTITAVTTLAVTAATLPGGTVGAVYTAAVTVQGGTLPYVWVISGGSLPPGLTLNSGTGTIGGRPTTPGSYSFSVMVSDSSVPAQAASQAYANITITQVQITTSVLPVGTAGLTYGAALAAQGGVAPYTWSIASGSLPSGLKLDSSSGALSGTPLAAGAFSLAVQVADSSSPPQSTSRSLTLTLNAPQATLTAPATQSPSQPLTVTLGLNQTTTAAITGSVALTFTPDAAGVSATYMDPALEFMNAPTGQATTYTFSVAAGAQTVTIPQIQPGTVAGDITITASLAGQTVSTSHVIIDALPPTIDSAGVQITNITSAGFDVEFNATSTPRDLQTAAFTFTAASGATLNGNTTFTVPVSSEASAWYVSPASGAYGSRLSLSIPFSFSGSSNAIASVTVTLKNSAGQSNAVTGTP